MIKLSNKDIADVMQYDKSKAVLVEKKPVIDATHFKAAYYVINFDAKTKEVLTKGGYLLKKFGSAYNNIIRTIPNFVQCAAGILYDKRVLVIYPNGETGIFDREGNLAWSGILKYHDKPVFGLALEGKYFWTLCPQERCVIRYSSQTMQLDLRIGGADRSTFVDPTHISVDSSGIYVCSSHNTVRRIDKSNFTVSDYLRFDEPIRQFFKFDDYAIAVMQSGTYLLHNNE